MNKNNFAPLPIPIRSTISMKNNWPPMDDADNSISPKVPSIMVSAILTDTEIKFWKVIGMTILKIAL